MAPKITGGLSAAEIDEFLATPQVGVLATIDGRGRPRTVPIWFLWEDGAAYMFTSRSTLKWRNLQSNPAASLCVDHRDVPYRSVILDGQVEESDGSLYDYVRRMALAWYGPERGEAFADGYRGDRPNVALFRLVPERITGQRSD
jgi:PPOX class probable F420-dependent enzyme